MSAGNGTMTIDHDVCCCCGEFRDEITWFDRCGGWVCLDCAYPDDLVVSFVGDEV